MKKFEIPALPVHPEDDSRMDTLFSERVSQKPTEHQWCLACAWSEIATGPRGENFVEAAYDSRQWSLRYHEETSKSLLRTVVDHMARTLRMIANIPKETRRRGLLISLLALLALFGVAFVSGCTSHTPQEALSRIPRPPPPLQGGFSPCPSMDLDLEYEEHLAGRWVEPESTGEEIPHEG